MNNTKSQQLAFDKFTQLRVGALFMKMGTGKTRVALELVNYNNVELLVYVCPYSTKKNIQAEIDKWGVNCEYIIVGYETIQASDTTYTDLLARMRGKRCFIVADESVFIKNENTKRFNRLLQMRELCQYALILNGTPITKNEWDIYNQMYFLSPKIFGMSRQEFLNTFFKKITYKKLNEAEKTFYKFSEVNAEYMQKAIAPYMFECDLDFNKKEQEQTIWVECEVEDYEETKQEHLSRYIQAGNPEAIINMLQKLNVLAASKTEKNKAVVEYIKDKKVIVYCNFLSEVKAITNDIDCYVITGNTKDRDSIIERFKNDTKPLVMTYGVGAYSLNLQFCNEIVFSSITFDYAKVEQSKYRIKRLGQERDIKYTYILANLGINKMIQENLTRKRTLDDLVKEKLNGGVQWLKDI